MSRQSEDHGSGGDFALEREVWTKVKTACIRYGNEAAQKRAFRNTVFVGRYREGEEHTPEFEAILEAAFEIFLDIENVAHLVPTYEMSKAEYIALLYAKEMIHARISYMADANYFITEKGYMGRGRSGTEVGDQVCILCGGKVPFILRENTNIGVWVLVGECCKSFYLGLAILL